MIVDAITTLLSDVAIGRVKSEHRLILQHLLSQTKEGRDIAIALHYSNCKKLPRRYPDPVNATIKATGCSRSGLFRAYGKYRSCIEQIPRVETDK